MEVGGQLQAEGEMGMAKKWTDKDLKFLRTASKFADEFVTCLSPHRIGCVVVKDGQVIGEGVNGPPKSVLHVEDRYVKVDEQTAVMGRGWFYSRVLNEWVRAIKPHNFDPSAGMFFIEEYIDIEGNVHDASVLNHEISAFYYDILSQEYVNTENVKYQRLVKFKHKEDKEGIVIKIVEELTCPRYIVGMKSGEGLSLCGCRHGESNSIFASGLRAEGATIYCYCGVPCCDCAGDIIHAGIKKVVCLHRKPDYSYQSKAFFAEAGIEIIEIPEKLVWEKTASIKEQ